MDIDTFLAKKAELEELLKTHGKEMLITLFGEFFSAAPEVKTVVWEQYTPYFNDGDPCVFRVYDPSFSSKLPEEIKGDMNEYGNSEDGWLDTYKNRSNNPAFEYFRENFARAEVVLESLGDHSRVLVTNGDDGIKIHVEEYYHD